MKLVYMDSREYNTLVRSQKQYLAFLTLNSFKNSTTKDSTIFHTQSILFLRSVICLKVRHTKSPNSLCGSIDVA